MTIKEYYQLHFANDVTLLIPDSRTPYFGHSWHVDCQGLNSVSPANRPQFLICLYFTVLVDQAMHAHYRMRYQKFEGLTRYPKFCHGLGQFQKNPRDILLAPIERGLVSKNEVDMLLSEGMQLFVEEVFDFFTEYMPEINPREFFETLLYDQDVQIPYMV